MSLYTAKISGGTASVSVSPPPCSIMAFLGSIDPDGWVICDGLSTNNGISRSNSNGKYNNLITAGIGAVNNENYTPPDYRGAFLRGAGQKSGNSIYSGNSVLGSMQSHATQSHSHTVNDPGHNHALGVGVLGDGVAKVIFAERIITRGEFNTYDPTQSIPDRIKAYPSQTGITIGNCLTTTGLTINTNENETRPYNCTVNWIIKL